MNPDFGWFLVFDPEKVMRQRAAVEKRFWKKVAPANADGCMLWTAGTYPQGYGWFSLRGKAQGAHRVAWELAFGAPPGELNVCHTCDTPACVNVAHLFLGTDRDNTDDKVRKGRQAHTRGEVSGAAKLRDAQVLEIRRLYQEGGCTQASLGKLYGVTQGVVSAIVNRRAWSHI